MQQAGPTAQDQVIKRDGALKARNLRINVREVISPLQGDDGLLVM